MNKWRFWLAAGLLCASQVALLHYAGPTIPIWALATWITTCVSGVFWMREDTRNEQRHQDQRDAWVQKITTAQGVRIALGPLIYVKPDTTAPPYPVTETSGEWLFRRKDQP